MTLLEQVQGLSGEDTITVTSRDAIMLRIGLRLHPTSPQQRYKFATTDAGVVISVITKN